MIVLMCCSCATAGDAVGAVVFHAAAGVGAAQANRAAGQCYAACFPGTTCNRETGYCEALPCHGRCKPDEMCVNEGSFTEHCEKGRVGPL